MGEELVNDIGAVLLYLRNVRPIAPYNQMQEAAGGKEKGNSKLDTLNLDFRLEVM